MQLPRLRRYARALTRNAAWADDLVQDTLERALRRRWLFRISGNLTAWLMTMLYRLYLNDAARQRRLVYEPDHPPQQAAMTHDPALVIDLEYALAKLSIEHRAVIVLIGLEQLSYKDAAEILNVPVGTVMSRLARARNQLQALLVGEPAGAPGLAHLTRVK